MNSELNDELCPSQVQYKLATMLIAMLKQVTYIFTPDSRLLSPDYHYTSSQNPIFPNFSIRLLVRCSGGIRFNSLITGTR